MKKRNWPEEIDWIRNQDQKMYHLINILSVAAVLFLVCVISYRAASFGTESVMAAGTEAFLADAGQTEMIRLTVSDHQMTAAVEPVQDAQQASLEPCMAVLNTSGQDECQAVEQESEYADLSIVQLSNYVNIREESNQERGILSGSGDICNGNAAELQNAVGAVRDDAAHYALVKADCQNVRGQPGTASG